MYFYTIEIDLKQKKINLSILKSIINMFHNFYFIHTFRFFFFYSISNSNFKKYVKLKRYIKTERIIQLWKESDSAFKIMPKVCIFCLDKNYMFIVWMKLERDNYLYLEFSWGRSLLN